MEASGFRNWLAWKSKKKQKNVFDKYLLHPRKIVLQELSGDQYHIIKFELFYYYMAVQQ